MTSPYTVRLRRDVWHKDLPVFQTAPGPHGFDIFRQNLLNRLHQMSKDPWSNGKGSRYELEGWLAAKFFIGPGVRKQTPAGRIIYAVDRSSRDVWIEVIWFRPTSASEDVSRFLEALGETPESPYFLAKQRRRNRED